MTENIAAAVARENARTPAGQFGAQPRTDADFELDVTGFSSASRTVVLPNPSNHEALTSFVGEEVACHRQDAYGGDTAVRFDGDGIVSDLKGHLAGASTSEEQLGELFKTHQHLAPDDYKRIDVPVAGASC